MEVPIVKRLRTLILALLVLFGVTTAGMAVDPDELINIQFSNETGYDFHYLFLSPGDSEYWGPDILGSERIFSAGETLGYYVHFPDECNDFDIMGVDEDGDSYILYDYTMCGEEYITFTIDDLSTDEPEFDFVELNITNDTGYEVYYLFVSPSDSMMWGVDQLDEETILSYGETLSLLVPVSESSISFDVRAVDEDEDTYTFSTDIRSESSTHDIDINTEDLD
jgi:hypothetical protein